jgi:rhamnulokinase
LTSPETRYFAGESEPTTGTNHEMARAVAIDLGAGSGRIALGELQDGTIQIEIVEQIAHEPIEIDGRLHWDFNAILALCQRGVDLATARKAASVGIDSWGVDHGYLNSEGKMIGTPVCYRDLSHLAAFERLKPYRRRLYELTGIQHQPFNTICQLSARAYENPNFPNEVADWLILPDLLGYLLSGSRNTELTQASTTQLMGCNGLWSEEAFNIAGWRLPERKVSPPGRAVGRVAPNVDLVSVGSHDTASAVLGFGKLESSDLFLNMGTWSLFGGVIASPNVSEAAEAGGFTNERTVDGKVRFLKNIPGFYFINRLHDELGVKGTVPDWLASAPEVDEFVDLIQPEFFNPSSIRETCAKGLRADPESQTVWAGIALKSLVEAVHRSAIQLSELTGASYSKIRIGGGGSQSRTFCRNLASRMQIMVEAGPVEATLVGNLAAQFLAQGKLNDWEEAKDAVSQSIPSVRYTPT